jgi:hypothetical protein
MKFRFPFNELKSIALLSVCVVSLPMAFAADGDSDIFKSGPSKVTLLEVYTSEGCSSCPPAGKWFSTLKENPRLWKDLVPVAFHVDYWDNLGWKDPFGLPEFSARQRAYSEAWNTQSVYTPGFVLNGAEWRGWFKGEEIPSRDLAMAGILEAKQQKTNVWIVRYDAGPKAKAQKLKIHGALLGFELSTNVKAGENRGRLLQHDFAVLTLMKALAVKDGETFQGSITLVPPRSIQAKRLAAAFWIVADENPKPLQATGGWIK